MHVSKKVGQWKIEYHVAVAPSLDPIPQAVQRRRVSRRRTPGRGRCRWSRSRWDKHRRERNGSGWDRSGAAPQRVHDQKRRTRCDGSVNILLTTLKERGRSFKSKTQSRKRNVEGLFLSIWQTEIDAIEHRNQARDDERERDYCHETGRLKVENFFAYSSIILTGFPHRRVSVPDGPARQRKDISK